MKRSIHAKCNATKEHKGQTLVCSKSYGHRRPQHYDASADVHWEK